MPATPAFKQLLNENPAFYEIREVSGFFIFDNHPEVKPKWSDASAKNPDVRVLVGRIGNHAVITKVFIPVSYGEQWAREAISSMRLNEVNGDCSICSKYTNLIAIKNILKM